MYFKSASTKVYVGLASATTTETLTANDSTTGVSATSTTSSTSTFSSTSTISSTSIISSPLNPSTLLSTSTPLSSVLPMSEDESDGELIVSTPWNPPLSDPGIPTFTIDDDDDSDRILSDTVGVTDQQSPMNRVDEQSSTAMYLNVKGVKGPEFFGSGERVGVIAKEAGFRGANVQDLPYCDVMAAMNRVNGPIGYNGPIFLNISFDRLCHQMDTALQPAVLVVLPEKANEEEDRFLSMLAKWYSSNIELCCSVLFWVVTGGTQQGRQAIKTLRLERHQRAQLLVLMKTATSPRPCIVERINGSMHDFSKDVNLALEASRQSLEIARMQRLALEDRRMLVQQQNEDLSSSQKVSKLEDDQKQGDKRQDDKRQDDKRQDDKRQGHEEKLGDEEKQDDETTLRLLRESRRARLPEPIVEGGVLVRVRTPVGTLQERFRHGSVFQVVYDFLGGNDNLPAHFILHRQGKVCLPSEPLPAGETITMVQKDKEELKEYLGREEVSFKHTVPFLSAEMLTPRSDQAAPVTVNIAAIAENLISQNEDAAVMQTEIKDASAVEREKKAKRAEKRKTRRQRQKDAKRKRIHEASS